MSHVVDMDVEAERLKATAEQTLRDGAEFRPILAAFEEGKFKGAVIIRHADDDDEDDKKCAFAEACTIITLFHADEAVVAFDAPVNIMNKHTQTHDVYDALNIMIVSEAEAASRSAPYECDDDGNFVGWLEQDKEEEEEDDINPEFLSKNMVATLAHFMTFHAHIKYGSVMMRTLTKRGHQVMLPDGQEFVLEGEPNLNDYEALEMQTYPNLC